jgi:hypothetical protein
LKFSSLLADEKGSAHHMDFLWRRKRCHPEYKRKEVPHGTARAVRSHGLVVRKKVATGRISHDLRTGWARCDGTCENFVSIHVYSM